MLQGLCPTFGARSCLAHLAKVQQGDVQLVRVRVCARAAVGVRRGAGAVLRWRQAAAQGQHVAGVPARRRGHGEERMGHTATRLEQEGQGGPTHKGNTRSL